MFKDSAKIYIGRHESRQPLSKFNGDLDLFFHEEWFKNLNSTEKDEVVFWLHEALQKCDELRSRETDNG